MYASSYFHPKYGVANRRVRLNRTACKMLRTVEALKLEQCQNSLLPPTSFATLTTDASSFKWAAVLSVDND